MVGMAPPFMPREATVSVAATTIASAAVIPGSGDSVRIVNTAVMPVRISFGCAAADAVANCTSPTPGAPAFSILLAAGATEILGITARVGAVAVMMTAGSGTIEITRGDGS